MVWLMCWKFDYRYKMYTLGPAILSSIERLSSSQRLKKNYCYRKGVGNSVLFGGCPFLGGSLIGRFGCGAKWEGYTVWVQLCGIEMGCPSHRENKWHVNWNDGAVIFEIWLGGKCVLWAGSWLPETADTAILCCITIMLPPKLPSHGGSY